MRAAMIAASKIIPAVKTNVTMTRGAVTNIVTVIMMSIDIRFARPADARAGTWRAGALALIMASLSLAPILVAHSADVDSGHAAASSTGCALGEAVKRDARAVGAAFKEGAHRVAVASKAVAHEIATAVKRGAAETRAAVRSKKIDTSAT